MKDIQIFNFNGNDIREITDEKGNPWFVAKDVCGELGISNTRDATSTLDEDEKDVVNTDTLGGKQNLTIINESGLYSLILRSRKSEAKAFKKWVTSEVLPIIRTTGRYGEMSEAEILMKSREILEEKVRKLSIRAQLTTELIEKDGLFLPSAVGKIIMGKANLFCQWLIDNKVMYRKGHHKSLTPYAPYDSKARNYFRGKTVTAGDNAYIQWYFTPKGLAWVQATYLKKTGRLSLDYTEGT